MLGAVRHAATMIAAMPAGRRQTKELERQTGLWHVRLLVAGVPAAEIEPAVMRWRQEIICELLRRRRSGGRIGEGDAA